VTTRLTISNLTSACVVAICPATSSSMGAIECLHPSHDLVTT
jgi:hypothetical protein